LWCGGGFGIVMGATNLPQELDEVEYLSGSIDQSINILSLL